MTATTASIVGFKEPKADLHRHSPRIFIASVILSIIFVATAIHVPLFQTENFADRVKVPPVIIHLENIPETRQQVKTPAPKLAVPLEVDDDILPDEITIESTELDFDAAPETIPPVIEIGEGVDEIDKVEEEIFEFFAVEEQPERIENVVPEYPDIARRAGIEGTVIVRALVGKDGNVREAKVLNGPKELHDAAIKAAMASKFKPARQNDMAVSCWVAMPFRFVLE